MSQPQDNPRSETTFDDPQLRIAGQADLAAINRIVAQAMAGWDISDRVRRLSLPLYRYAEEDIEFLDLLVFEREAIEGVAAFEPLEGASALLHGLYVLPEQHRSGVGSRLLRAVESLALRRGFRDLRVRARPESVAFFAANGYCSLPRQEDGTDYPWLMNRRLDAGGQMTQTTSRTEAFRAPRREV